MMNTPKIVSPEDWRAAHDKHREDEKALMRASDDLAAERRALPRMSVDKDYEFEGPGGKLTLSDLFEGRSQLMLYSFMWESHTDPTVRCPGCSMVADNTVHLSHLNARDVTYALTSPDGTVEEYDAHKERMGWDIPWYAMSTTAYNEDHDVAPGSFGLNVFLKEGDQIVRTYYTNGRGAEGLGTVFNLLDRAPLGRQESWQDNLPPAAKSEGSGSWWHRHDEYPHLTANAR